MTEQNTYLEFIDEASNAHKFYEVRVIGSTVTIRFGRLQTQGTIQVKTYATPEQAQAEANKKIREKQRKGYGLAPAPPVTPGPEATTTIAPISPLSEPAATTTVSPMTETPKPSNNSSAVLAQTPPTISLSQPAPSSLPLAPFSPARPPTPEMIRWRFDSGFPAFGLAVDENHCWLGNEKGQVFKLDHQGQVLQKYQLPDAVKCIVTDDIWLYVGCDNGNIYDLTGKFPYLAYEIERGLDLLWLDIYDGMLGVSDANGGLSKTDPEGEVLWNRLSGGRLGWMLCCDAQGFYHGHTKGVTMYEFETGRQAWHQATLGKVLFGCQNGDQLFVATSGKVVQSFRKTGEPLMTYPCEASVYCCTTDATGSYLYAADSSAFIYCFNQAGERLWKVATGNGSALSMQFFDQALYFVTNQGLMVGWDLQVKASPDSPPIQPLTPAPNLPSQGLVALETTTQKGPGVILECFRQGQQLRVHPLSEGYHRDWMVQFPRDLRREGDRYWVQELREAKQGGYYRTYGDIKRLVED
ncbi:WGR domain-containing protein [Synechocystis sp. LKSZ1]|uniref:WGR domain-containing protein n=1 Tax=Synechocystis sp. LKSZ1 TaxID=3144951 RepID=UPI00336BF521